MSLKPAELRAYLVVVRAIQRDKNAGFISERQVSERSGVSLRHAHNALVRLIELDMLHRKGKPGATATYSLPHTWKGDDCTPTGKQLERPGNGTRIPTGIQNRFPTGIQHLESSENTHAPEQRSRIDAELESPDTSGREFALRNQKNLEVTPGPHRLTANLHAADTYDEFRGAGWDSPEEFEDWWGNLVRNHPNRNKNGIAKAKALELIADGRFNRAEFEAGYEALALSNQERWREQSCRYAPNLWQLMDDRFWEFQMPPTCKSGRGDYQTPEEFWQQLECEDVARSETHEYEF